MRCFCGHNNNFNTPLYIVVTVVCCRFITIIIIIHVFDGLHLLTFLDEAENSQVH